MIEIYTLTTCGYCHGMKEFFKDLKQDFTEHVLDGKPDLRAKASQKAGGWPTVPMVFIKDHFVGGYQDVVQLHRQGGLDELLNS
ncbi:MAG: glutaredoxin domain-containing protein [Oligoflexales bacterium]